MTVINRINVVGTSGSGKSTVAKLLSQALDIPYVEMDKIYWRPNWTWAQDQEFLDDLRRALAEEKWVLDGNYNQTLPLKWERVQMVIWVDLSFSRTLYQVVIRAIKRSLNSQELWPETGNRETWRRCFFSKDSIILWMLKSYWKNKIHYEKIMNKAQYSHIRFVRLRSQNEIREFLAGLGKSEGLH